MWRKGSPCALLVRLLNWHNHYEKQYEGPSKKVKIKPLHDPAILLLGNTSKGNGNINYKRYRPSHVYSSIVYNSQDMETTKVPISR